jgi:ABC-type glycerol-3-phosphate transport system substrate-binding protein
MKNHWRFLAFVLVLVLAILACGGPTTTDPSDPNVLFQDDFSNTGSGWDQIQVEGEGMTDYENGYYRIQVLTSSTDVWANLASFTDTRRGGRHQSRRPG